MMIKFVIDRVRSARRATVDTLIYEVLHCRAMILLLWLPADILSPHCNMLLMYWCWRLAQNIGIL